MVFLWWQNIYPKNGYDGLALELIIKNSYLCNYLENPFYQAIKLML